jgi:hypothetical protein
VPQVLPLCQTSLGLAAVASGNQAAAEAAFCAAIALIEDQRAPLPSEEFRSAFLADKLLPYHEMMRICLDAPGVDRVAEGLHFAERARARALAEVVSGAIPHLPAARDSFDAALLRRLDDVRADLNALYSYTSRPRETDAAPMKGERERLQQEVLERESTILEITRQLQQRAGSMIINGDDDGIARVQAELGADTVLVEYASLDGALLAFVISSEGIEVVRGLGSEAEAADTLGQLRFQLGTLHHGAAALGPFLTQLTTRAQRHLQSLYDLLIRPFADRLGGRRLGVIPHGTLHAVPFLALHDGERYLIEEREVFVAPSTSLLARCLAAPRRPVHSAVLLAVADQQIPKVRDEVLALAPLFDAPVTLLDAEATLSALRTHAPHADVLHLACHGRFRPDNPLFSALQMADGWLTVGDAYALALDCQLVTLSACETGVSQVAPGDELFGLARGFLAAGAPALLLSQWAVDDAATASLMTTFYRRLRDGVSPVTALRHAQLELLRVHPHPFFWAAFTVVGRW